MGAILPAAAVITSIVGGESKKLVYIEIAAATAADTIDLSLYGFGAPVAGVGTVDWIYMMDVAVASQIVPTWVLATNVCTVPAGPAGGAISLLVLGDA